MPGAGIHSQRRPCGQHPDFLQLPWWAMWLLHGESAQRRDQLSERPARCDYRCPDRVRLCVILQRVCELGSDHRINRGRFSRELDLFERECHRLLGVNGSAMVEFYIGILWLQQHADLGAS